jgi:PAS domain S-box-containing protein
MTAARGSSSRPLSVLIVEDSARDAQQLVRELRRAGYDPQYRRVSSEAEMSAAVEERPWDLVLCDAGMPEFSYQQALAVLHQKGMRTPLLLVSGTMVDEAAVTAVRAGARDIIMKDRLSRLAHAVERELEAAQIRLRRQGLEEEVRRSEKRFRALIEHCFEGICLLDAEGRFLYTSPSVERMLGYSADELIGKRMLELVAPEDRQRTHRRLSTLREYPGETVTVQVCVVRKDGERIWIENVATNLLQEASVGAVVLNFRDISGQKQFERILCESEERAQQELAELEHIYHTAPVGLCLLDTDLRYMRINERLAAMNGQPAHDHLGRTVWEVIPDAAPFLAPLVQRIIESGRPVLDWQSRTGKPSGGSEPRDFLASYYPVKTSSGKVLGVAGVVQEITELKRVERALRESEQRFRALIEKSADGFALLDPNAKVLYSGPPVLGYEVGQLRSGEVFNLVHPDDRVRARSAFSEVMVNPGRAVTAEYRVRRRDGSWRWIEAITRNLLHDPAIGGIVANYRDVTERKRLEEQLRQTHKLESIGLLAGGVAHDFNNLLTGMLGNATLALDALPPGDPCRPYIEEVIRAAENAAHLTRQLLAYSGKGRFVIQPVDLSELTRQITTLVRTSIPKTVQLNLELAPCLPAVDGDPGQLQQLIMNLVINGAEAIGDSPKGTVEVTTGVQAVDESYIRGGFTAGNLHPGEYVSLQVCDNGVGMDAETQSRIFDPFFSTKFSGRGLGLSAVLGIVRGHHGALRVHSAPGKGTTFVVLLPAKPRPAQSQPPKAPADLTGSGTILVADDEDFVRSIARHALERCGYRVLLAANGQEAIDLLRDNAGEVVLVLLDLIMPVLSAEHAVPELKRIRPDVKIVLTSGFNESEAIQRFSGAQLAGFVQKPFTTTQLAEKVKSVLGPGHGA